jgi:hypothetical protein
MASAYPRRETAWFVILSLTISWAIGAVWVLYPRHGGLTQWMMVTPALVGFACAWFFRHEPPRAAGFRFTGWAPWIVALTYPFVLAALAVGIGYAVGFVKGDADFIVFHPEQVTAHGGMAAFTRRGTFLATAVVPWLAVALFYRFEVPDLLGRLWSPLRLLSSLLAWVALVFLYPGRLGPPGALGEELGWRGTMVRLWKETPIIALVIGMPVWAAFHLPVIFAATQRGHVVQNITFLASIAAAAPVFAALYLWCESVWPCAVLHFSWNLWNPFFLGDVYHGAPGLFGGAVWFFNGEGVCGLLINGALSAWLVRRAFARRASPPASAASLQNEAPAP